MLEYAGQQRSCAESSKWWPAAQHHDALTSQAPAWDCIWTYGLPMACASLIPTTAVIMGFSHA